MKKILILMMMVFAVWMMAVAAPASSILAARSTINAAPSETSPNPYVTRGLIAMWDGEWNAGWGKHEETPTIWKDLVGDADWDIISGRSFTSNSLAVSGRSATSAGISLGIGYTIQVVAYMQHKTWNHECLINLDMSNPSCAYHIMNRSDDFFINGGGGYYGIGPISNWSVKPISYSCFVNMLKVNNKNNIPLFRWYVNGNAKEIVSTGSWMSISYSITNYSDTASIGEYNLNGTWMAPFYGNVYCIRVYNRTLTENEVSANYLVDKERFGL